MSGGAPPHRDAAPAAQDRAALAARLAEPPDVVPRWHRSNAAVGSGPAGYVYQVQARAAAAAAAAAPRRLASRRALLRRAVADLAPDIAPQHQAINDRTGELLAVKLVGDDGAAGAAGAAGEARGAALRVCLATRHPNLVRWAAPARPESGSIFAVLPCLSAIYINAYIHAGRLCTAVLLIRSTYCGARRLTPEAY